MENWLDTLSNETKSLFNLLNAEEIPRTRLAEGFQDFSDSSKDELIAHLAQTLKPAPTGRLITRLKFIQTSSNTADLNLVYLINLRSDDPQVRKASLFGLNDLSHPAIEDFALNALREDADQVATVAVQILLPKAQHQARIRRLLHDFYRTHKDEPEFYTTLRLLEAHQLDQPEG